MRASWNNYFCCRNVIIFYVPIKKIAHFAPFWYFSFSSSILWEVRAYVWLWMNVVRATGGIALGFIFGGAVNIFSVIYYGVLVSLIFTRRFFWGSYVYYVYCPSCGSRKRLVTFCNCLFNITCHIICTQWVPESLKDDEHL